MTTRISLIVPAHNEEGNLERLVEHIRTILEDFKHDIRIILVDDNSTDRTPEICDRLAEQYPEVDVIHRHNNPGFGNAIKDGLRYTDGDILIPFMGDLSDDPADIPKLVQAIESGYDVAYGSRFIKGGAVDGYPRLKLIYNRAYNNLIRLLFGVGSRDTTNAFTAYRREVIDEIEIDSLQSTSFDLTAELPLRAHILGFRSTEVPVSWRSREEGVSDLNATMKGPLYLKRVLHMFIWGNLVGLKDLFRSIAAGSPLRILAATIVGVLILVGLFSISGFEEVFKTLAQTRPWWLVLAAGAYFLSFTVRTWRYRVLLRTVDHLASRAGVFRSILAGWFVNFILPARAGDAARALALKTTEDVPVSVGFGLVVIERMLDMFVLGSAMLIVAIGFLQSRRATLLALGAFGIMVVLVIGLIVTYYFDTWLANLLGNRFPRIEESIRELNQALRRIATNPYSMTLALLLSLPIWALEMSTIYWSATALGIRLDIDIAVAAAVAGFVAQAVPITPAGIGTYEAAITGILAITGWPASTGTAIALLDHFVRAAVTYVFGAISLIHIGFQSRVYFRDQTEGKALEQSPPDRG